jgi:hypothetical protein
MAQISSRRTLASGYIAHQGSRPSSMREMLAENGQRAGGPSPSENRVRGRTPNQCSGGPPLGRHKKSLHLARQPDRRAVVREMDPGPSPSRGVELLDH